MSSAAVRSGLTWEEFLDLPDEPRYKHAELWDGELVLMNPPIWLHQHIVGSVMAHIWLWTRSGDGRGSVTLDPPVRIAAARAYLPDVAWFREEHARPEPGERHIASPPDLAVEVLSESTRRFDIFRKRRDYAAVGVRELWLIDPEGDDERPGPTALVLRPPAEPVRPAEFLVVEDLGGADALTSPLLPGLRIDLAGLVT